MSFLDLGKREDVKFIDRIVSSTVQHYFHGSVEFYISGLQLYHVVYTEHV